ncbi:MAG TPA: aquaporin [Thermoleophilaceae bacterium]|jgi:MIP family channel proteins|nr:aquaporin [Thermoleophilaceae bacterium]
MNPTEVTEVQERGPAGYLAEFVGTLLLVFFVTAVVSLYITTPNPQNPNPFIDFSVIGLVHAFLLFGLVQTLGLISGGHFNPAVTVAITVLRRIKPADAAIYIIAQLGGAVAGALLTKALLLDEGKDVNYGTPSVSNIIDGNILPGMVVEALGTFFLVWVIVGVAVNPRALNEWAALSIGTALGMGVMVLAPLTGAGFNPARSFGPALVSGAWGGADTFILVYVVAPVIGAIVACAFYFAVVMTPGKREPGGLEPVG